MLFTPMNPPPDSANPNGSFASAWDAYVAGSNAPDGRWPGDEWGDEYLWNAWFERLFAAFGVDEWERAVEIGQGAGKYTERVLRGSSTQILALDVSPAFQELCKRRLAHDIAEGRLLLRQVDERDPDALARAVEAAGWTGHVDAVFSIDTLVHLTITQLTALLLGATKALRAGGLFIGTFANATSRRGQDKLLADIDRVMRAGGDPSTGCFHWSSPDLISALGIRCGYTVELCDADPAHERDGHFVLRFTDPAAAAEALASRRPAAK
jgi:SAM-dependent methyltransferase